MLFSLKKNIDSFISFSFFLLLITGNVNRFFIIIYLFGRYRYNQEEFRVSFKTVMSLGSKWAQFRRILHHRVLISGLIFFSFFSSSVSFLHFFPYLFDDFFPYQCPFEFMKRRASPSFSFFETSTEYKIELQLFQVHLARLTLALLLGTSVTMYLRVEISLRDLQLFGYRYQLVRLADPVGVSICGNWFYKVSVAGLHRPCFAYY
jgi:hypothetical protein